MTRVGPARPAAHRTRRRAAGGRTLLGFGPLQRFRKRAATCAGFASPGCAASPRFLGALTLSSAHDPAGLVSYRRRSWGFPFRGLFLPGAVRPLGLPAPPDVVVDRRIASAVRVRSDSAPPCERRRSGERGPVTQGCGPGRARLQGFALVLEVRTPVPWGLATERSRSSPEFSRPPGSSPSPPGCDRCRIILSRTSSAA